VHLEHPNYYLASFLLFTRLYVCAHIHTVPWASCTIVNLVSNMINEFGCFSLCSNCWFLDPRNLISTIFAVSLVTCAICPTSCVTLHQRLQCNAYPLLAANFLAAPFRSAVRYSHAIAPARQPSLVFCPDRLRCALRSTHTPHQSPRRSPNLSLGVLVTFFSQDNFLRELCLFL
jgi:hypothetical protein